MFHDRWGWYGVVKRLSNNDLTKFETITEMNLYNILNDLSFEKESDDIRRQIELKQRR